MVEPVKTVIPETTPTRLTFFQKVLLKKALKKVEPDKNKLTKGEIIATGLSFVLMIVGLLFLKNPFISIPLLLLGLILDTWLVLRLLSRM